MSEKTQLSARQISKIIREIDDKYEELEGYCQLRYILGEEVSYQDLHKEKNENIRNYLTELESRLGDRLTLISSERGEGSGDYDGYEWLLQLGDRYFMVYGYYSSWEGYDCDDYYHLNEVKPVEKTIIVYEPIN